MKRLWPAIFLGLMLPVVLIGLMQISGTAGMGQQAVTLNDLSALQIAARPGALSEAHAFLEADCASCHIPNRGADAASCIGCHANEERLLSRQNTAFHAVVQDCGSCHGEHGVKPLRPFGMDHLALFEAERERLAGSVQLALTPPPHAGVTGEEATLDCTGCHANEDPHHTLFGTDCVACHGTATWDIAEFRHPPATSTDCAQCHQAPPSHYMMHFEMVSMRVAGVEHANVRQCFLCHQTSAWNEIPGVGWYKHH